MTNGGSQPELDDRYSHRPEELSGWELSLTVLAFDWKKNAQEIFWSMSEIKLTHEVDVYVRNGNI